MEKPEVINYRVPNLEKGLAVLDYLALQSGGRTLQEIKLELEISQTTAYRILNTMVRAEYLVYDEGCRRYRLSRKLLSLGFHALNEHQLLETIFPYLRELRDATLETACFGVMGEEKGIFIDQAEGAHTFSFKLSPGKPLELHCSAPGKAIMAFLPEAVRKRYLACMDFKQFNERTITSCEAYLKELDEVFERGYATDREEELTGVICIGAPIFNYKGYPCGAIWISGPKERLPEDMIRTDAALIKDIAARASAELGYIKNGKH